VASAEKLSRRPCPGESNLTLRLRKLEKKLRVATKKWEKYPS
jgi:hypothetical protein